MCAMIRELKQLFTDLRKDQSGATMIEYSLLIGLITAAVVAATNSLLAISLSNPLRRSVFCGGFSMA